VAGDPRIRASDADRDRAATLLGKHHAAGRLNSAEFHERMEKAMDAATIGELDELMDDLPAIDIYDLPDASLRRRPRESPGQSLLAARPDADLPSAGIGSRAGAGLSRAPQGPLDGLSPGATAIVAWATVATALIVIGTVTAIAIGALVPIWAFVLIPVGGIFWLWFLNRRSRR
jgi:Domain of unknown function (DUF1707)